MEINDCEIETNNMNLQDMNITNDDELKKQLEDFIRECNEYSQLFDGDYKMLSRDVSI